MNTINMFLISIILTGNLLSFRFGEKPVDLLEHNLIDLEKAIEFAQFGGESDEGDAEDSESDDPDDTVEENTVRPVTVTFRIRGKNIFYSNSVISPDEAKTIINEAYSDGLTVVLIDDYADSKSYKEMDKAIDALEDELGFKYEER